MVVIHASFASPDVKAYGFALLFEPRHPSAPLVEDLSLRLDALQTRFSTPAWLLSLQVGASSNEGDTESRAVTTSPALSEYIPTLSDVISTNPIGHEKHLCCGGAVLLSKGF